MANTAPLPTRSEVPRMSAGSQAVAGHCTFCHPHGPPANPSVPSAFAVTVMDDPPAASCGRAASIRGIVGIEIYVTGFTRIAPPALP